MLKERKSGAEGSRIMRVTLPNGNLTMHHFAYRAA